VLLAYISMRPQSGYSLKRLYRSFPATVNIPSAGALYPALRRLSNAGLLSSEETVSAGQRTQRLYHLTEAGRAVHEAWLREPVDQATVANDLGLHLVRFAMMQDTVDRADVLVFLRDLAAGLETFIERTKSYLATEVPQGQIHGALALQHGIAVHQASLDWARDALRKLSLCSRFLLPEQRQLRT
jgi:DNA-binding MarR family transcriptional regulator